MNVEVIVPNANNSVLTQSAAITVTARKVIYLMAITVAEVRNASASFLAT